MPTKLENRSLDRAITVLEALARSAPCSLHRLHEDTALPKSTIRRLLGTLKKRHFIRVGISDGLYRINVALPWAGDSEFATLAARAVEAASPHMVRLTEAVEWPSDLHVHRSGRMRIVESTRSLSPFRMGELRAVDLEVNIFAAAAGLAYLSTLADDDVRAIVKAQQEDPRWALRAVGIGEGTLLRELADIRKTGYAKRRPGFAAKAASRPFHAIAVPISGARKAIGALTLFWPRKYMAVDRFAHRYLGELKTAAEMISADLARLP